MEVFDIDSDEDCTIEAESSDSREGDVGELKEGWDDLDHRPKRFVSSVIALWDNVCREGIWYTSLSPSSGGTLATNRHYASGTVTYTRHR